MGIPLEKFQGEEKININAKSELSSMRISNFSCGNFYMFLLKEC